MTRYDLLWQQLDRVLREPPVDLAAAVRALPEAGRLPLPWATWTLIGLMRHRRRQLWVAETVATRLGGDLRAISRRGAFGHPPDRPRHGLVPGLTDWEYSFHGKGCWLTHRGTGESIDVDFFAPNGEYFDVFFYVRYLQSLRNPEPPEARLIALHRSFESIRLAVAALLEAGMLAPLEGREPYAFRLAQRSLDHEDAIDAFCEAWIDPDQRIWFAAVVGDWLAAHERVGLSGDQRLMDLIAGRAAACRTLRHREALSHGGDERRRANALLALDDLDATDLPEQLDQALQGTIDGVTWQAVQIIRRHEDPAWCPALYRLFHRLDPGAELPQPYLWVECERFLLRHGYRADEMRNSLGQADGLAIGEAALLALEYDPGQALPLFRRALRSAIPETRTVAAAGLALIERRWCLRELIAVLHETNDQAATAECRAALLECHDNEARSAVREWEEANPHEPESGGLNTIGEMILRNRAERIRWKMETLHDRVMKVRDREPGEDIAT